MRASSTSPHFLNASLLLALTALSCSKPSSQPGRPVVDAGSFDKSALVAAFGACAVDSYRAFDATAKKLAATPSRETWTSAMDAFEEVELMQWGPLGGTSLPGGQGLRDTFYAWPLLGRCQIDRAIVNKSYEAPDFTKTSLVTTRGLGALEYLLFFEGAENACGSSEDINTSGAWAALSKDEIAARKLAYIKVLTADVGARSAALVDLWDPTKGNYLGTFSSAGKGSAVYPTVESALNSVVDALYYVDSVTKDRKVAIPIGLVDPAACSEPPCGELLESRYAVRAKQHVRTNLLALRKLLIGCAADGSGLAFDDLLDAAGASALADDLDADLKAAIATVDAFPYPTFEEAMTKGDLEAIKKVQLAIKAVTDTLKTEFISVLKLELPKRVAGDMD